MSLRANWKAHRDVIQKEGLHVIPHSDACKSIWKSIQREYNSIQDLDNITIPVRAVDDSVFDEKDSNFKKFDTVPHPLTSNV